MKQPTLEVELTLNMPPRRPSRRALSKATEEPAAPPARLPRIIRLMALAIKFQEMVDRGEVRDYADLAGLGYVSRARITQIMNLLSLAPDIQEAILIPGQDCACPPERDIRRVVALVAWVDQRRVFSTLRRFQKEL